jgi:hypothetical protein
MFRHVLKNAARKVFIGENPVEAADKMKQAAEAIIKGTTSQAGDIHRVVNPQGYRTFSVPRSSPNPISYSTNSPITPKYEFQPQTPVKSKPLDTEEPLLPKLPRHRSSMQMQTPLSYAPTLHDSTNVIRRNLFD